MDISGIVRDAMACASFLKFHPKLAKEIQKPRTSDISGRILRKNSTLVCAVLYLPVHQRGAAAADSAFAEDVIFDESSTIQGIRSESQGEMSRSRLQMDMRLTRYGRTGSMSFVNYRDSRSVRLSPQVRGLRVV